MRALALAAIFTLLLFTVGRADILGFRVHLQKICSPQDAIVTKKILFSLAKYRDDPATAICEDSLKKLIDNCGKRVTCEELIVSFEEYMEKDTSSLIGE